MEVLDQFSPVIEVLSVDEAFVDLTGTRPLFGDAVEAVRRIKARIREETELTASAGLAPNKFLAKVASELQKPDGLVVVAAGIEAEFLAPLGVERIWGVGKVMAADLAAMGITTVGQLQRVPRTTLVARFGQHGAHLHELAFGRDDRPVEPWAPAKSMGAETTFEVDCREPDVLTRTLREQAERVARELRQERLRAARVTLKLRYADFRTLTRAVTGDPVQDGLEIFRRAAALLAREQVREPVRLIGVSASGLGPETSGQLSLLDPTVARRERLARVVDTLVARFGQESVVTAALLPTVREPARPRGAPPRGV
jgi:DNA polymerase-4